ncbi:flavoprotein [Streptomyces aurantiacus]|uniref:Flavoprotein domain-containing protein n=1 Tax=Streptomyces aurantiacus TaxID=47760 RepID=A0A7G1P5D6_9ACTN|nr:flavoprotein [Streptomyces aurantiacus]BCL30479.1 hypothetical protein GCM10017557_53380 [Streptomyces aurantiacus]
MTDDRHDAPLNVTSGPPAELGPGRILLVGTGAPTSAGLPMLATYLRSSYKTKIKVVLTKAAQRLVSPALLSASSGQAVLPTQWEEDPDSGPLHVTWANWPDLIVVWPATLEFMARCAAGLASDVPSAIVLSSSVPVLFAPSLAPSAVHAGPYRRVKKMLREDGHTVVDPIAGISLSDFTPSEGACIDIEKLVREINNVWLNRPCSAK